MVTFTVPFKLSYNSIRDHHNSIRDHGNVKILVL